MIIFIIALVKKVLFFFSFLLVAKLKTLRDSYSGTSLLWVFEGSNIHVALDVTVSYPKNRSSICKWKLQPPNISFPLVCKEFQT